MWKNQDARWAIVSVLLVSSVLMFGLEVHAAGEPTLEQARLDVPRAFKACQSANGEVNQSGRDALKVLAQFFREQHSLEDEKTTSDLIKQCRQRAVVESGSIGSGSRGGGTLIEVLDRLTEVEKRISNIESFKQPTVKSFNPQSDLKSDQQKFQVDKNAINLNKLQLQHGE